jgi:putative ABC transport system substrate-binding protein
MKKSNRLLAGLLVAGLGIAGVSNAATGEEPPRIGYLAVAPLTDKPSPERAGFIAGLRELGYENGKNIQIVYRSAEGATDALPFVAEELVESGVKLVVTAGNPAIRALQQASDSIPIVILFSADPVAAGFAKSLAHPGGNITGMSQQNLELGAKRLELLKETVPTIRRVAVLWDSSNAVMRGEWESTSAAAKQLGIELIPGDAAGQASFEKILENIQRQGADAIVTLIDLRTASYRQIIPEFALKHRLPSITGLEAFAENGGLMSYAPDFGDLSRRSAAYVDKILRGTNPGDLPIQQPTHYSLVLNLKSARAMGITIPKRILERADRIIE